MRFRKSIVLVFKRYLLSETSRLHTFVTKLLSSTDLICLFPYRYYFYKTRKVPVDFYFYMRIGYKFVPMNIWKHIMNSMGIL